MTASIHFLSARPDLRATAGSPEPDFLSPNRCSPPPSSEAGEGATPSPSPATFSPWTITKAEWWRV